jgi:hypothetical protein
MARPLYALPLVPNPQARLLGWQASGDVGALGHPLKNLVQAWWDRWVGPHADDLARLATAVPDLRTELGAILATASREVSPAE